MNYLAELMNRLDREYKRIKERFNETDYDHGYLRGMEKAMGMVYTFMEEQIERMARLDEEIYMEEYNGETD